MSEINDTQDTRLSAEVSRLLMKVDEAIDVGKAHFVLTDNPHRVTKEQIGLGNADNTADMDKPVSLAVKAAMDEVKEEGTAYTDAAKTEALAYADGVKTEVKTYTDTAKAEALAHADAVKSEALLYADGKKTAAVAEAAAYTDEKHTSSINHCETVTVTLEQQLNLKIEMAEAAGDTKLGMLQAEMEQRTGMLTEMITDGVTLYNYISYNTPVNIEGAARTLTFNGIMLQKEIIGHADYDVLYRKFICQATVDYKSASLSMAVTADLREFPYIPAPYAIKYSGTSDKLFIPFLSGDWTLSGNSILGTIIGKIASSHLPPYYDPKPCCFEIIERISKPAEPAA